MKWPEKKEIDRILYDSWVNRHKEGWNACHDAFMKVIREKECPKCGEKYECL